MRIKLAFILILLCTPCWNVIFLEKGKRVLKMRPEEHISHVEVIFTDNEQLQQQLMPKLFLKEVQPYCPKNEEKEIGPRQKRLAPIPVVAIFIVGVLVGGGIITAVHFIFSPDASDIANTAVAYLNKSEGMEQEMGRMAAEINLEMEYDRFAPLVQAVVKAIFENHELPAELFLNKFMIERMEKVLEGGNWRKVPEESFEHMTVYPVSCNEQDSSVKIAFRYKLIEDFGYLMRIEDSGFTGFGHLSHLKFPAKQLVEMNSGEWYQLNETSCIEKATSFSCPQEAFEEVQCNPKNTSACERVVVEMPEGETFWRRWFSGYSVFTTEDHYVTRNTVTNISRIISLRPLVWNTLEVESGNELIIGPHHLAEFAKNTSIVHKHPSSLEAEADVEAFKTIQTAIHRKETIHHELYQKMEQGILEMAQESFLYRYLSKIMRYVALIVLVFAALYLLYCCGLRRCCGCRGSKQTVEVVVKQPESGTEMKNMKKKGSKKSRRTPKKVESDVETSFRSSSSSSETEKEETFCSCQTSLCDLLWWRSLFRNRISEVDADARR